MPAAELRGLVVALDIDTSELCLWIGERSVVYPCTANDKINAKDTVCELIGSTYCAAMTLLLRKDKEDWNDEDREIPTKSIMEAIQRQMNAPLDRILTTIERPTKEGK